MPLFDQTLAINREEIATLVHQHWHLNLGDIIKASQNHTFQAQHGADPTKKFIVRVTPDPQQLHAQRIRDEILFVCYLAQHREKLHHVCAPIPTVNISGNEPQYLVEANSLLIVAYEWAQGEPLNFMDFSWMTKPEIAFTWGRWFAQFHRLSRSFGKEYPHIAGRIQRWDMIHNGILRNAPISSDDVANQSDPREFGILHGDLNISNFYYLPGSPTDTLSVFDWDQVQQGWYLYDLAQAVFSVYMLAENGSIVDHAPVPEANPTFFETNLIAGYTSIPFDETETNPSTVDMDQFHRMVALRMYFYETFCRQAKDEGDVPPDMAYFIDYIIRWFDARNAKGKTDTDAN